jgi:AcrR family transcriptional regulator
MSSIAAVVGGSKTTLWTYFPSKEALFEAVTDRLGETYADALMTPIATDQPLAETLRRVGTGMMNALMSGPLIALMRLVTGEAGRFPELARIFHDRGPRRGRERLAAYFAVVMKRGDMRISDPLQAADQFAALCQSGVYQQTLLGLTGQATPRQVKADIEAAIVSFVKAWKPDRQGGQ